MNQDYSNFHRIGHINWLICLKFDWPGPTGYGFDWTWSRLGLVFMDLGWAWCSWVWAGIGWGFSSPWRTLVKMWPQANVTWDQVATKLCHAVYQSTCVGEWNTLRSSPLFYLYSIKSWMQKMHLTSYDLEWPEREAIGPSIWVLESGLI